jgi:hypothetical protein
MIGRTQRPSPPPQPSPSRLRISGAVRLGIAVLFAGGLTAALIVAQWGPLNVKATVVGYPIFNDFNPYVYSHGYELAVVVFPLATLVVFYALTWVGPRIGLATPAPRGRVRPVGPDPDLAPTTDPDQSSELSRRLGAATRVAFVGGVLGLEVGIAADHLVPQVIIVATGYCLLVGLAAVLLTRLVPSRAQLDTAVATVNAVGTVLTLAGLCLVSAHTELTVIAGDVKHSYPWCPVWVGVPLAIVVAAAVAVALRRSGRAGAVAVERWAVLIVPASVALFILAARLPGDLGQLGLFEEGQQVTEAMLVGHGWLPWRDVFLAHGLLGDVAPVAAGWGVFGNSYWGAEAGFLFLLGPLTIVTTYLLMVYLVRRSWPLILIAGLIFVGTWLGAAVDPRYSVWPLILLLLTAALRRPARWRAIVLGLLVVAQGIVSDEMAPCAVIVLVTVAAYEWYWRTPGASWATSFRRTIWLTGAIVAAVTAFVVYMGVRSGLVAVIYDTVALVPGHTLDGGNFPEILGATEPEFVFIAIAPVAAVLISFAYAVIRLRLRRPFLLADWPMGAAAVFVFFYYTKFLARMDLDHAHQPFEVATPLILYIIYRAITAAEAWIRSWPPIRRGAWSRWMPAYPVALALLAYFVVAFWGPLTRQVRATPSDYRPTSPVPATIERVGYSSDVDGPGIRDLRRIFDAYLGPHGRVMDITDEPGLFYYFLGREPSSRWFAPNGVTQTPQLQDNVIGDLRRDPPKLIVFDDTDTLMYGLEAMDSIPAPSRLYLISRWILRHYRPLIYSHGRVIYALPSVHPVPVARLNLIQRPVTKGVQFLGQSCLWGDSPTFLVGPAMPQTGAASVPVRVVSRIGPELTLTGWAGDSRTRRPAREVIATLDGRVVAHTKPNIERPDLPKAGSPRGFLRSGYRLSVPVSATAASQLRVFAIGQDGSMAELPIASQTVLSGRTMIAGRLVTLQPKADVGSVDTEVPSNASLEIAPPSGSSWANYPWFEVQAPAGTGFVSGQFSLSDEPGTPTALNAGHLIAFNTLTRSPHRYTIPVASCQQWQGYGSRPLYLTLPAGQLPPNVRLVR